MPETIHYWTYGAEPSACGVDIMTTPYAYATDRWADVDCPDCIAKRPDEPTVKLHITIDIRVEDNAVDTGLTVSRWNALTDVERSARYREMWNAMAEQDNGGVWVVTEGAEGI